MEPHWQVNSNFSPPLSRRWDFSVRSDGVAHETERAPISGSTLLSHGKGSRNVINRDQYPNHHHSGSPSNNFQAPPWKQSSQRFDLGEFSTPSGGARPRSSLFAQCNEMSSAAGGASSVSNSLDSASPHSKSSPWVASSSNHPILYPPRNFSGRRSFISKPVHPLIFQNPVPDGESDWYADGSINRRMTLSNNNKNSLAFLEDSSSLELEFQKSETSSRRKGFRWTNASSYDFGFEGETIDLTDPREDQNSRSMTNPNFILKCGLCERLLSQKSPWSSHRMVRNSAMPITGILPCSHVYHADCLEESTPGSEIHQPPCPLCIKAAGKRGSGSFSETLQVPPKFIRRSAGTKFASKWGEASSIDPDLGRDRVGLKKNRSLLASRKERSLVENHFKKRFSFKGKDLFNEKMFE